MVVRRIKRYPGGVRIVLGYPAGEADKVPKDRWCLVLYIGLRLRYTWIGRA